ncbi:MAG: hypothetical protein AMS14_08650 [Planctomycetes bacterium DG_20]|nr:MAG: hypothetical protein AMS14_08650 [Planctomycetes bacterium DG_20]
MADGKGWFKRFLNWFRGDDLDELLGRDDEPMLSAEVGGVVDGAVSGAEAAALVGSAGTTTAVVGAPAGGPIRRAFIDDEDDRADRDTPETVDEAYILSREGQIDEDRAGGEGDGVTISRVPPRPEEVILAKVDEGVGDVTRLLGNVNSALVEQTEVVEGLAKTLNELPAAVRAQGVYLETLTRQLEAQNARSAELAGRLKDLPAILGALPEQGRAQLKFLQQIAAGLDGQADRENALAERVGDAYAALETINETTRTQVRVLQEIDRSQRATLDVIKESSELGAKRYAWLMGLMWTVTVVTVGGIAFVVYWITRHLPTG